LQDARRAQQFRVTSRAAIGAIPTVELFRHVYFGRTLAAGVAAAFEAFRNVTVAFHRSMIEQSWRQNWASWPRRGKENQEKNASCRPLF
jgi:hypothetical protein